jgi:hypothetical protein
VYVCVCERRLGFHPRRRIDGFEASWTQICTATGFPSTMKAQISRLDRRGDDDDMVFDSISLGLSFSFGFIDSLFVFLFAFIFLFICLTVSNLVSSDFEFLRLYFC